MLARTCYAIKCPEKRECRKRFVNAKTGDHVYCPDGSKILIDWEEFEENVEKGV